MKLNFSENFKQLRKEKGDTQEKVAEMLGVSGQTVSRWELSICYPDLELLPSIANYFGVTVDSLLSNDKNSKQKDGELFWEQLDGLEWRESTERIDFVREYCRKYPENDEYAYQFVYSIAIYACGDDKRVAKFMPILLKTAERLLQTQYRYATIQEMAKLCSEQELDKWLSMAPYSGFGRRDCLIYRAIAREEKKNTYIHNGLKMIEVMADQLDQRLPDYFGPEKKEKYQREVLRTIESFGDGGGTPDGWKMFYAYKQLVLAACLFAQKKEDDGWKEFDSAIEKCKYIYALEDEWLSIGGSLFADLKVSKDWNYAIDKDGNKHKLFGVVRLSFYHMYAILDLLTSPRWKWLNSVRETEKYREVVSWVSQIVKAHDEK